MLWPPKGIFGRPEGVLGLPRVPYLGDRYQKVTSILSFRDGSNAPSHVGLRRLELVANIRASQDAG